MRSIVLPALLTAISWLVHAIGIGTFYWVWNAAFPDHGERVFNASYDVPFGYATLGGTALVAGTLALVATYHAVRRGRWSLILLPIQWASLVFASAYLYAVWVFESVV